MNFDKALLDPASVFPTPDAVCDESNLTRSQKIEVLRRWEYDARELQVAAEENMTGDSSANPLSQVLAALRRLDAENDPDQSSPTKQK